MHLPLHRLAMFLAGVLLGIEGTQRLITTGGLYNREVQPLSLYIGDH